MRGSDCLIRVNSIEVSPPEILEGLKLSVVMPVYNEAATIEEIVRRVLDVPIEKELLIVDDASTDDTMAILERIEHEDVRIFHHDRNKGKSAALRTGFEHVTGDVVVIQDGDLEYDPRDYLKLLAPIADGRADVVYGSRFIGGPHRVTSLWHYVGNRLITLMINTLCNLNLTDASTCYKAFKADILKRITFRSEKFGFCPEFTVKSSRLKYRIYEVAISYSGRGYSSGKKITWMDGVRAALQILRHSLFSRIR